VVGRLLRRVPPRPAPARPDLPPPARPAPPPQTPAPASVADPYASALNHDSEAHKGRLAPVVVVFAGKGGCAKTSTSLYLARSRSRPAETFFN
jgi:Mrp family chromosome partitioning ATPase